MIGLTRFIRTWSVRHPERGRERFRRVGLAGSTAVLAQGLFVLTGLVSIPLTASYLGAERYGVWLTISSLITWLTFAEFGLGGNALVNTLAEADGRDDRQSAKELVATAFWALSGVAVLLGAVLAVMAYFVPVSVLFRVSTPALVTEVKWGCLLAIASFLITLPLGIVPAIYRGYQRGYVGSAWIMIGNLVSLIVLVAVTRFHGGLPQLVFGLSSARVLVVVVNSVSLFGWEYPWLRPSLAATSRKALRRLMGLGGKYAVTQLVGMGVFQSQPMIITQVLGPASVFVFVVAQRLMTLPQNLIYLFTQPLVSAYGEAKARQDWPWIWRALRRSSFACGIAAAALVVAVGVFARPLIRIWVGPQVNPSNDLLVWLAIYSIAASAVTPVGQFLLGIEKVGAMALTLTVGTLVTVGLSIGLAHRYGLNGIAIAMVVTVVFVTGLSQLLQVWFLSRAAAGTGRSATAASEGAAALPVTVEGNA